MRFSRLAATAVAALVVGCAVPSVAGAIDYCVKPNTSCGPNNYDLQQALNLAAGTPESDRILLGAAEYVAPAQNGFYYSGFSSRVEIVGAGRGKTTLTGQEGGVDRVLWLGGTGDSSVHDLTVRLPRNVQPDFRGLLLSGGSARRVDVVEDPTQGERRYGVQLWDGAVLEDSSITLDPGETTGAALFAGAKASAVRGSVVRAAGGVEIAGGGTIERTRVFGQRGGVTFSGGSSTITDTLIVLAGTSGTALVALTEAGKDTNVTADGLTALAQNGANGGIVVSTQPDTARSVHLALTNSIVRASAPLRAAGTGQGAATISASYSDYDPSGNVETGGNAHINATNVTNVGPAGFSDASGHEYSLLPGSLLLDAGDPAAQQGVDIDGNPRVADGNGDGIARRDPGAFELQPPQLPAGGGPAGGPAGAPLPDTQAPLIGRFRSTRRVFAVARAATPRAAATRRGTTLRYTLSEAARVVIRIKRKAGSRYRTVGTLRRSGLEGANRIRFTGRIGRRPLRAGRYRAVIRATDAAGNRSAPRAARFRVVR